MEDTEQKTQCYLCKTEIEASADYWCFGCKHHICDKHPNSPWGSHSPESHDDEDDR